MTSPADLDHFDRQVRFRVYAHTVETGRVPTADEVAQALACSPGEVQAAFQRLAAGRALVLQGDGEILMAEPFSAVPTAFAVEAGGRTWWGNCIWDALGIPAALRADARVLTSCGCCGEALALEVRQGALLPAPGVVHYAVPARDWWKDVVFA